jgi:hypothetical protein
MECGSCGAKIAEKAIVCYRCGAPTAIPAPPERRAPQVTRPWLLIVVLLTIAAVLGWLAIDEPAGTLRQYLFGGVALGSVAWGGHLAYHGWRR